jgi:predicted DNA-binding protein
MKRAPESLIMHLRLPKRAMDRIDVLAKRERRTRSFLVRDFIADGLARMEGIAASQDQKAARRQS